MPGFARAVIPVDRESRLLDALPPQRAKRIDLLPAAWRGAGQREAKEMLPFLIIPAAAQRGQQAPNVGQGTSRKQQMRDILRCDKPIRIHGADNVLLPRREDQGCLGRSLWCHGRISLKTQDQERFNISANGR